MLFINSGFLDQEALVCLSDYENHPTSVSFYETIVSQFHILKCRLHKTYIPGHILINEKALPNNQTADPHEV